MPASDPARRPLQARLRLRLRPTRRRERGAALSVVAVAMSVVLVIMGTAYLGATVQSTRQSVVGAERAQARAACEGAITVVLRKHAREVPAGGGAVERTVEVGGLAVLTKTRRTGEGLEVRAEASTQRGEDTVRIVLVADAAIEGPGRPPRLLRITAP